MKKHELKSLNVQLEDGSYYFVTLDTSYVIGVYTMNIDCFVTFDRKVIDARYADIYPEAIKIPLTEYEKSICFWESENELFDESDIFNI